MDLHPYDGVERRFRHTDAVRDTGLGVVVQLLHLPQHASSEGVLYDLSFYSGGIGILDNLAITLPADRTIWAGVVAALRAKTPEDASDDPGWADELVWLLTSEEELVSLREAAVQFINTKRHAFQTECLSTNDILFADGSGVNYWIALWGDETRLNYCGYDQG
jgi:hypothetical protein